MFRKIFYGLMLFVGTAFLIFYGIVAFWSFAFIGFSGAVLPDNFRWLLVLHVFSAMVSMMFVWQMVYAIQGERFWRGFSIVAFIAMFVLGYLLQVVYAATYYPIINKFSL